MPLSYNSANSNSTFPVTGFPFLRRQEPSIVICVPCAEVKVNVVAASNVAVCLMLFKFASNKLFKLCAVGSCCVGSDFLQLNKEPVLKKSIKALIANLLMNLVFTVFVVEV